MPCPVGQTEVLSLLGSSAPVWQQDGDICQQSVWEMDEAVPRHGSPGWRPRRTGSGIRSRRNQPPLVEAPECTTAYQGGDFGGAAGFEVYVPQLRCLIATRRQHTGAIGAKLCRGHPTSMALEGGQQAARGPLPQLRRLIATRVAPSLAVSTRVPSGLNWAELTPPVWPSGRPASGPWPPPTASPSYLHSPSARGCHRG